MKKTLRSFALGCCAALALCAAPAGAARQGGAWWNAADRTTQPALAAVLGPDAELEWDVSGGALAADEDPLLRRRVLVCGPQPVTLQSRTTWREVDIECLARLATTVSNRQTYLILTAGKDPAVATNLGARMTILGTYDADLAVWLFTGASAAYDLRAYDTINPTWEDAIRIPIEHDMGRLPLSQDKWLRIRYHMGKDRLRVWVDDRLLVNQQGADLKTTGSVQVFLYPGDRLADIAVRPLGPLPALYETIRLDGYIRDRALVKGVGLADGALPFGKTVMVGGIPFAFAERMTPEAPDHLDISRSFLREGRMFGYFGTSGPRFAGAMQVDPARIRLRIPNDQYDAMYVIAAFDGEPERIPLLSASFYRDGAGFAQVFEGTVPAFAAKTADSAATPLPVRLANGKAGNLWLVKIPLDPGLLASFADMNIVEVEFSKQAKQYRGYPDPFIYGWHMGGLPSGVHIYAVTFHRPDLRLALEPTAFGHVWTDPAVPGYTAILSNSAAQARTVSLAFETASYDTGERQTQEKSVTVPAGGAARETLSLPVKKNGYHDLTVTMKDGTNTWIEKRSFVRLAQDTRAPFWEAGQGPMFGFWSYLGGHYTPPGVEIMKLMKAAGARASAMCSAKGVTPECRFVAENRWPGGSNPWPVSPQWDWAAAETLEPAKVEAYKQAVIKAFCDVGVSNEEYVAFFPEPAISRDLTAGNPPEYWGEPPYQMNAEEKKSLRVHMNTARVAAEAVRAAWPRTKLLIPHGDPLFILPFLQNGYPTNLIDGCALDMIGFERLPEQQIHQMSTHRLYVLKDAFKKAGMNEPLLYYMEGIFTPTEPGACTWEEQGEIYHRWTLLSLAYGIERFYSGWFAFDCGNYYGAEHYGGCGIQRRIPYADPKPAYAHYATMTRMLERTTYEKWLPTGSHTVYCLKFVSPTRGPIYALWTIRGRRSVTLALAANAAVTVTDSMDNGIALTATNQAASFTIGQAPVYVTGAGEIVKIALGEPDHSDAIAWARNRNQDTWHTGPARRAPPVAKELAVASLGDGTWTLAAERDALYENNNYDSKRYPGKMRARVTGDWDRPGAFLAVHLDKQAKERQLMPWYSVLKPAKPVPLPGKAAALGLWVKAASDWGRVVYCLQDAKGERWYSIGTKDEWNCNDPHGWSSFNFDGWRYLRFEMPSSSEYDCFREFGTTWWGSYGGDGVVDLPLTLDKIFVERRTHVLYVNDIQPANPADVLLGALVAEYVTLSDATDEAVALNRSRMPLPQGDFALPNPIAKMTQENELPAVKLEKVTMPDWGYDGTRCHVHFTETPLAAAYQVWVSAYPDGKGAAAMGTLSSSGGLVWGLRAATKLYLWVTYTEKPATGKTARAGKPSNVLPIELVDAFGQK